VHITTHSNVDNLAGSPYFGQMLRTPVVSSMQTSEYQARITPSVLAARDRAIKARRQKLFETGERIFEQLKGRATTQEVSRALKGEGLKFLKRLEVQGFVVCVEEGVGTKPARWKWKGRPS